MPPKSWDHVGTHSKDLWRQRPTSLSPPEAISDQPKKRQRRKCKKGTVIESIAAVLGPLLMQGLFANHGIAVAQANFIVGNRWSYR